MGRNPFLNLHSKITKNMPHNPPTPPPQSRQTKISIGTSRPPLPYLLVLEKYSESESESSSLGKGSSAGSKLKGGGELVLSEILTGEKLVGG